MTTIIAIEHASGVTFGSDSQMTSGSSSYESAVSKTFQNGPATIGVCGYLLYANALRYAAIPEVDTWDADRWMVRTFVPAVIDAMQTVRMADIKDPGGHPNNGSGAIVAVAGRAYALGPDLSVTRHADGVYVDGSGGKYARGALDVLQTMDDLSVEDRIRRALDVAATHDVYTSGPMHVIEATP